MKKLILLLFIPLVFACGGSDGDSDSPCPNQPQLTTLEVSNISIDENTDLASATFSGEIQNIQLGANCETLSITNQGFVYSTNIQPTTSDNVVNANGENASANVSDLIPETTYYVRAYLTNTLGTFYGNEVSFTTPQSTIPVYLAENGVTIKARPWAEVGMTGIINGETYTIVDRSMLEIMIEDEDDISLVCTTRVTNMSLLFAANYTFNVDVSSWDVSNVTDMYRMFMAALDFDQNLEYWDVSNVTSMEDMFHSAFAFNADISSWDVSSVTNMNAMFNQALNFNQPLNNWDVSNVTDMDSMFISADNFNQPLNNWDVSNVTTMNGMFSGTLFNQPLNNWDVSNVTDMYGMFGSCPFNQPLNNWDVSNVTDVTLMFFLNTYFNQDLSGWNVDNVTLCSSFCLGATNWSLPKPNFTNCSAAADLGCD